MVRTFALGGRPKPFATAEDNVAPPMGVHNPLAHKYSENHTRSDVVFGGPDNVTRGEILLEQQAAYARRPHAGRSQLSSVVLTDEVRWPGHMRHRPKYPAERSNVLLTDALPPGAGKPPPTG